MNQSRVVLFVGWQVLRARRWVQLPHAAFRATLPKHRELLPKFRIFWPQDIYYRYHHRDIILHPPATIFSTPATSTIPCPTPELECVTLRIYSRCDTVYFGTPDNPPPPLTTCSYFLPPGGYFQYFNYGLPDCFATSTL